MSVEGVKTRVLITVMTYPHPSKGHKELVCTAGITEAGEWVRIYPIDYRYRPYEQQFRKYQWVEIALAAVGHGNDNRKESRKPDLDTLQLVGERISTKNGWQERRKIIDRMPHMSVTELKAAYENDGTSLGILRPDRVLDMTIKPVSREWKPKWQMLFLEEPLFGSRQKPLRKLPFKWSYVFESDGKSCSMMVEDWELGVLFLKLADEMDEGKAAEKVREKYLSDLCAAKCDTRFFMGTRFPYNVWLVLGVFYPPKIEAKPEQLSLF